MRRVVRALSLAVVICAAVAVASILFAPRAGATEKGIGSTEDVVGFGQQIELGDHQGDVLAVGGAVVLRGRIGGDVMTLGSDVTFAEGAFVVGDLVAVGGRLSGYARPKVGGDALPRPRAFGGSETPESTALSMWSRHLSPLSVAVQLSLLIVWFIVTIVVTLFMPREVRGTSLEVRASPLHTFVLGLVGFTSFILTAVVFSYLIPFIVGIPLLLLLATVGIVAKVFGMMAIFHTVGYLLFGPRTPEQAASRSALRGDLAMAILGLVVLGAVRMIPVVGNVVWMTASVFGIGAALATKFGRREPWFLAWRPVAEN